MSAIYLFRHGQAGLRDNYDTLSDQGRHQATLLGEHLAAQKVPFTTFYSGALLRQQQTAQHVRAAYPEMPEPIVDPLWNEFDLSAVYDGIAPQLAADDAAFRAHFESMRAEAADKTSTVHRRWTASDIAVVRAWVDGRYQYDGESWHDFTARVSSAMSSIQSHSAGETIAISTSATPIAVWVGLALHLGARYIMRLAGALYNASFSSLRFHEGELHLFSFNNVPHLADPAWRTFR